MKRAQAQSEAMGSSGGQSRRLQLSTGKIEAVGSSAGQSRRLQLSTGKIALQGQGICIKQMTH